MRTRRTNRYSDLSTASGAEKVRNWCEPHREHAGMRSRGVQVSGTQVRRAFRGEARVCAGAEGGVWKGGAQPTPGSLTKASGLHPVGRERGRLWRLEETGWGLGREPVARKRGWFPSSVGERRERRRPDGCWMLDARCSPRLAGHTQVGGRGGGGLQAVGGPGRKPVPACNPGDPAARGGDSCSPGNSSWGRLLLTRKPLPALLVENPVATLIGVLTIVFLIVTW